MKHNESSDQFFREEYKHVKMLRRKRGIYQIEPRIYVPFMFEWDDECKVIKKTISD